jgi:ElaA protein
MRVRVSRFSELDTYTLYALLRLRVDVFVVEQECAYAELDGRDLEALHLWIERDGEPVAYLRILAESGGGRRIGRIAVAKHARGDGLAASLLAQALEVVGDRPCVLDAQSYLVEFYRRYGFEPTGPEYDDEGIPHVPMARAGR